MAISNKVAITAILVYLNLAMFGVLSLDLHICASTHEVAKRLCCIKARIDVNNEGIFTASDDLCMGLVKGKGAEQVTPEIRKLFDDVKVMCDLPDLSRDDTPCRDVEQAFNIMDTDVAV